MFLAFLDSYGYADLARLLPGIDKKLPGFWLNALLCVMEAKSFSQRMMQRCYDYLKAPMTITY